MRDLELWRLATRRVGAGSEEAGASRSDPRRLVELLGELARTDLHQRGAFASCLLALLEDPDGAVREATVRCLAGARGVLGLRALCAAMDDEDEGVRSAAVMSMITTARDEPMRLAHAAFHPRADVRRTVLSSALPRGADGLGIYLRADPENAELARSAPWPERSLELLFDLCARGHVDPDEATRRLAQTPVADLRQTLLHGYRRSDAELDAWMAAFARGERRTLGAADLLDAWCGAFDPESEDASKALVVLRQAVLGAKLRRFAQRTAVALLGSGIAPASAAALRLCVAAEPNLLACESLSIAQRREAAWALLETDVPPRKMSESAVLALFDGPVVRNEDGSIDLTAAVCISGLLPRRRTGTLLRHFGENQVVEALSQQLRAWVALCHLPTESKKGNELLLGRMRNKDPRRYHEMLAAAVAVWFIPTPDRVHELVRERIKPKLAGRVLSALMRLVADGTVSLRHKHWVRVIGVLVSRANETDLRAVVEEALAPTGLRASSMRPEEVDDLGAALLKRVAHEMSSTSFGLSIGGLGDEALVEALRLCEELVPLLRDQELALAKTLRHHHLPEVARWSERVLLGSTVKTKAATRTRAERAPRRLSAAEQDTIATADILDIETAVGPALASPTAGLCAALGARSEVEPRHMVVVALFACTDPLTEIAEVLDPWVDDEDAAWSVIRTYAVGTWQGLRGLPPQTNALLHRWEGHELAFADWLEGEGGADLEAHLREIVALPGLVLRRTLFEAMASVCERWRYRDTERLARWAQPTVFDTCVGLLDSECGESVARILAALYVTGLGGEALDAHEEAVRELEPDLDDATRRALDRWIPFRGLGSGRSSLRRRDPLPPADLMARIARSVDIDFLEKMCRRHEMRLVHEACLRMVVLGRAGQMRLLSLFKVRPELRGLSVFLDSVALWTDLGCVSAVRVMAMDPGLPSRLRFRICMALHDRGEGGFAERALAAVAEPCPPGEVGWFSRKDRGRLRKAFEDEVHVLVGLTPSPHPHAYRHAVRTLLESEPQVRQAPRTVRALKQFLEQGTTRAPDLRRKVLETLSTLPAATDLACFVVLAPELLAGRLGSPIVGGRLGPEAHQLIGEAAVHASLLFGAESCTEVNAHTVANTHVSANHSDSMAALRRSLFDHGVDAKMRKNLVNWLSLNMGSDRKLARVAEVFAWGVRRGRELTGQVFKVHMTDKRADYGFTFMDQRRIYVTALPLLRGDRNGRDIVEGLILHEFGHHMYHGGKEADAVWKRAQREGLHRILNLVADEHLERNLRAIDPAYGDRLKRLAAFAFGHSAKALQVSSLLDMLLGASFEVLSAESLGVAFEPERVEVQRGALLRELDRRGHPYARFVRALRMGLGNRVGDAQLAQALELFKGGFRHLDMQGLYEVTLKLADIYGGSQALGKVFGGHEDLDWEDRDGEMHGAGVSDEAVQREVERILGPPEQPGGGRRLGTGGRLAINVAEDEHFDPIETIERVPPDRERHRELARELRRYADRLREYLERLGLAHVPRRARLRGRAFDRTRAQAVVIRRDPRMLIAREQVIHTDLFIGVVVDCSGSMSVGQRMDVAHRFGVLIAEAVAPLAGVDARFFGFTDSKIYDAGDQHHCAVTSLEAGGGNNDAAGLLHAAQVAADSTRKAKLLVMISDGLPTECSVAALRGLVNKLGRKGLVCAQVAVRALEEECFPHYVVIEDDDVQASVRRFGEIVCRLVGRTLGK